MKLDPDFLDYIYRMPVGFIYELYEIWKLKEAFDNRKRIDPISQNDIEQLKTFLKEYRWKP